MALKILSEGNTNFWSTELTSIPELQLAKKRFQRKQRDPRNENKG